MLPRGDLNRCTRRGVDHGRATARVLISPGLRAKGRTGVVYLCPGCIVDMMEIIEAARGEEG